jgi:hypothetical protein
MLQGYMLQVLITVWIGVHPVTYTLPHRFPHHDSVCQDYANALFAKRKDKKVRMTIECVRAVVIEA